MEPPTLAAVIEHRRDGRRPLGSTGGRRSRSAKAADVSKPLQAAGKTGRRDAGGHTRAPRDDPRGGGRQHDTQMEIVYGKRSVRAVFDARPEAIRRVVMREGAARYLQEFIDQAKRIGVEPELLRTGEFLRQCHLTEDDKHQGIFVVTDPVKIYSEYDFDLLNDASVVLVLDQVSNPQNFGTIIRTAAFFGVDAVVWPKNRAVDITPTVSRVAVGGTEFIKLFRITNLARSLELLKDRGFWIYGFDERGENTLAATKLHEKAVVVIGAEGEGMRHRTKIMCDELIRIPGGRPGVENLNAAIAAAIVMAEIFR